MLNQGHERKESSTSFLGDISGTEITLDITQINIKTPRGFCDIATQYQ